MFAHVESLVGIVDDDGVVEQVVCLQIIVYLAHALIDRMDGSKIVAQISLILPHAEFLWCHVGCAESLTAWAIVADICLLLVIVHSIPVGNELIHLEIVIESINFKVETETHILDDVHLLTVSSLATIAIVVIECRRQSEGRLIVHAKVGGIREPCSMRSLMVHEHEEWLALVSIVEKLLGMLGHKTSRITLLTTPFVVGCVATEHWIPVCTLVVEGVIIVEAFRSGLEMPLAYHCCLIARLLHQFADEGAC